MDSNNMFFFQIFPVGGYIWTDLMTWIIFFIKWLLCDKKFLQQAAIDYSVS